jgi:hypothetical protein
MALALACEDAMAVETMSSCLQMYSGVVARGMPRPQSVFFAESPASSGGFALWVQECALRHSGPGFACARSPGRDDQLALALPHDEEQDAAPVREYKAPATVTGYDIAGIGQSCRDRCDCENRFDELKNPGGWGGFTTRDMNRSQIIARAVAMVSSRWSRYARAANLQARREVLTSRPLLRQPWGALWSSCPEPSAGPRCWHTPASVSTAGLGCQCRRQRFWQRHNCGFGSKALRHPRIAT